jgi:threonine dehydratase
MTIGLAEIEAAAGILDGQVVRTPCLRSARLSEVLGAEITLKL